MTTPWVNVESIGSYFKSLSDPRHTRKRKHLRVDVVVIAVCGMVCGCDGPTAIHRWAAQRLDWLRSFLPLANGIPSRDCFRRLLMALQPQAFQKCFQNWIAQAVHNDDGPARLVAIDGKTCRRSHDAAQGLGPLHLVSAWATEQGIALGQSDGGHGRTDERASYLTQVPPDFIMKGEWPWVKAIGYAVRVSMGASGRETSEIRYFILSRYLSGKRFSEAVRGHWGIESLPWTLDVTVREDDSRPRERTLGNNLSWLRRFAVTLLKRHPVKDSLRGKMIRCMVNTDFLTEVLTFQ